MTNRITVQQVVEAYKKTGLRPRVQAFYDEVTGCACALGAVSIARNSSLAAQDVLVQDQIVDELGLDVHYTNGFCGGFDRCGSTPSVLSNSEQLQNYQLGRQDGAAARKAVFG